jgi:hypothetical protein
MINSQISKFPQNTSQHCLKTVLKVAFLLWFFVFVQIWIRAFICYICKKEKNVFGGKKLGSANCKFTNYQSANQKMIRSANRKSAKCTSERHLYFVLPEYLLCMVIGHCFHYRLNKRS